MVHVLCHMRSKINLCQHSKNNNNISKSYTENLNDKRIFFIMTRLIKLKYTVMRILFM